jgi:chromosome segregation ATPase
MMGGSPPATGGVSDSVFALLTALGDPEKAKAKLTELASAQATLEQAKEAHDKALYELNEKAAGFATESSRREAEVSRRHAEVTASATKLTADAAAHQDLVAKQTTKLAERERQAKLEDARLAERSNTIEAQMSAREQAVSQREHVADSREKELDDRHSVLDTLHEEAMAIKTEFEGKMNNLRALIDPNAPSAFKKA